jgi:hypothetical protein
MFLMDNPVLRHSRFSTRKAGIALVPKTRFQTQVLRSTSPSSTRPNLFSGD